MGDRCGDQTRLQTFAARWNHSPWLPKSIVRVDEDEATCQVVGEIAVQVGGRVTRAFVDTMVITCVPSMFKLFAAVDEELDGVERGRGLGGNPRKLFQANVIQLSVGLGGDPVRPCGTGYAPSWAQRPRRVST